MTTLVDTIVSGLDTNWDTGIIAKPAILSKLQDREAHWYAQIGSITIDSVLVEQVEDDHYEIIGVDGGGTYHVQQRAIVKIITQTPGLQVAADGITKEDRLKALKDAVEDALSDMSGSGYLYRVFRRQDKTPKGGTTTKWMEWLFVEVTTPASSATLSGSGHALDSHSDVTTLTEAKGDILVHNGTSWNKLAIGADGYVLAVATDTPAWEPSLSGSEVFKTVASTGEDVVADAVDDTLTLTSADAKLTIAGTAATDTILFTVDQTQLDHGSIGGLTDDDHAHYMRVDGTRAYTAYMDLPEIATPAAPAANHMRLFTEDFHGFTFYSFKDAGGMVRRLVRDSVFVGYNGTGSTIAAGRIVYASGATADVPTIALAKADALATMPAIGVTIESIANTAYGRVMQVGLLEGLNTSAYSVGDTLYVSAATAGIPTATPPTYPNVRQEIGTILVDDAAVGAIQIVARTVLDETIIDHDGLLNFAADEHIAHSGVTLTAGTGLTGGGTIAANRTFALTTTTATLDLPVSLAGPYLDGGANNVDISVPYFISNQLLVTVTTNDTDQDGEMWWRVQLPDDFASFASDAIKYYHYVSDTTNCTVTFSVTDLTDTFTDGAQNEATITQTTITAAELTGASVASSAGSILVLKARVVGDAADIGYIGGVTMYYNKT
jgi:hypothetical protein